VAPIPWLPSLVFRIHTCAPLSFDLRAFRTLQLLLLHVQATAGCAPRKAEALRLAEDVTRPLSPIATASSSQTPVKAKKTNDNFSSSSSSSSNATQTTLSPHQHQQALSPRTPQSARQKKVAATSDGGRCEDASKTNKDGGPSFWLQFLFPEQPRTLPAQMQVLALAAPIGVALVIYALSLRHSMKFFLIVSCPFPLLPFFSCQQGTLFFFFR